MQGQQPRMLIGGIARGAGAKAQIVDALLRAQIVDAQPADFALTRAGVKRQQR